MQWDEYQPKGLHCGNKIWSLNPLPVLSDFYCLDAQIDSRERKEAFGELRLKFLPLDHLKAESLLGIGS